MWFIVETGMEQAGFPGACTFREITTVWGHGTGAAGVWSGRFPGNLKCTSN